MFKKLVIAGVFLMGLMVSAIAQANVQTTDCTNSAVLGSWVGQWSGVKKGEEFTGTYQLNFSDSGFVDVVGIDSVNNYSKDRSDITYGYAYEIGSNSSFKVGSDCILTLNLTFLDGSTASLPIFLAGIDKNSIAQTGWGFAYLYKTMSTFNLTRTFEDGRSIR